MTGAPGTASESWKYATLGELVTVGGLQLDPSADPERKFNYLSLEHIEAGTGRIVEFAQTHGREIGSNKTNFKQGDVLYGRLRPYLQKVIVAPFDGIAVTELLPLRAHGMIDPEFLREVFLGPDHLADVTQLMSGARMPRVRSDELLRLSIPVPPLDQQQRIARALSVLRHRVAKLRRKLEHADDLASEFEKSILTSAFNGELSARLKQASADQSGASHLEQVLTERRASWELSEANRLRSEDRLPTDEGWKRRYLEPVAPETNEFTPVPEHWTWASLSQLSSAVEPLCYGVVQPGEAVTEGVPLVRVQDLQNCTVKDLQLRQISPAVDQTYARSRLSGGEVLVSLVGSIGRVAVVPNRLAGANIARALAKVTPGHAIPSQWIAFALQTPRLQNWMAHSARGVARNTLNLSHLAHAPIPLPPAEEMEWLVRQIDFGQVALSSIRKKLADALAALDKFMIRTQARVLSGALVLEDPGEEAFSVARAAQFELVERRDKTRAGRRKVVTRIKVKDSDRSAPKRDLATVLAENPKGMDPLRLLEAAGYALEDVEAFYKALATAVSERRVREERFDPASVTLRIA